MKKILLVFMAAILAIGFSAFAPQKANTEELWYDDGTGTAVDINTEIPCPNSDKYCYLDDGGIQRQLFFDEGLSDAVPGTQP